MKKTGKWLWRFGDFELHTRLRMETRRNSYGHIDLPAWRMDDCMKSVLFKKHISLENEETVTAYVDGEGTIIADNQKYGIENGKEYKLPAGEYDISTIVVNISGIPSIKIDGENVFTDESWIVTADAEADEAPVACWNLDSPDMPPSKYELPTTEIGYTVLPADTLYVDAGEETMCKVEFDCNTDDEFILVYGESKFEANIDEPMNIKKISGKGHYFIEAKAFRYLNFKTAPANISNLKLHYEYLPLDCVGKFNCSDEMLNKIFSISERTLRLCSRELFIDGIKRDRWVWSGDAIQMYKENYYTYFNNDICQRTMLSMAGQTSLKRHINGIPDYTYYWLIAFEDYYLYTGDIDFIRRMWGKIESVADFVINDLDERGMYVFKPGDWVFVDWTEFDDTYNYAQCAEQILLYKSFKVIGKFAEMFGYDTSRYEKYAAIAKNNCELFWDEEKGGYVDSFETGNRHIMRQQNIFALLYLDLSNDRRQTIIEKVLKNSDIPEIHTPYFRFYELDAMFNLGERDYTIDTMREYWGGMVKLGATSFWEDFWLTDSGEQHYNMYNIPGGKSLCHAWSAGPLYIIGKYICGVYPTSPAYKTFEIKPYLGGLEFVETVVPTPKGNIEIYADKQQVKVKCDFDGGTLIIDDKTYSIPSGGLTVER